MDEATNRNGQDRVGFPERPCANPFSVPGGYFAALEADVRFRAKLEAWRDGGAFSVPEGYFEHLADDVLARTAKKRTATVFRWQPRRWIRYAAAASVAIVSVLGIYTIAVDRAAPRLAAIPEEEIIHYLASSADSGDLAYIAEYLYQPQDAEGVGQHLDDEDLEDYLNHTL